MYRKVFFASILLLTACGKKPEPTSTIHPVAKPAPAPDVAKEVTEKASPKEQGYTDILMHDVRILEGGITLNVPWMRGRMYPTEKGVIPSLETPSSFSVEILDGVFSVSLSDVAELLNTGAMKNSPLSGIKLSAKGKQLQISGMLHKVLPVQALVDIGISPDGEQLALHIAKLDVLKMPVGGLLKAMDVKPVDLIDPKKTQGISISGNDIVLDTSKILPPPSKKGKLSSVHLSPKGELVEVYGSPRAEVEKIKQWRNFIRLRGGVTQIGRLTMQPTDILVIDTSQADWFLYDQGNFPEQLVNGYARLTPDASLQMFIPDFNKIANTAENKSITVQWMKNRKVPPPPDVP